MDSTTRHIQDKLWNTSRQGDFRTLKEINQIAFKKCSKPKFLKRVLLSWWEATFLPIILRVIPPWGIAEGGNDWLRDARDKVSLPGFVYCFPWLTGNTVSNFLSGLDLALNVLRIIWSVPFIVVYMCVHTVGPFTICICPHLVYSLPRKVFERCLSGLEFSWIWGWRAVRSDICEFYCHLFSVTVLILHWDEQEASSSLSDILLFKNNPGGFWNLHRIRRNLTITQITEFSPYLENYFSINGEIFSFCITQLFPSKAHLVVCCTKRKQYDTILKLYLIMFMVYSTW